jgi:hypothetical protein
MSPLFSDCVRFVSFAGKEIEKSNKTSHRQFVKTCAFVCNKELFISRGGCMLACKSEKMNYNPSTKFS